MTGTYTSAYTGEQIDAAIALATTSLQPTSSSSQIAYQPAGTGAVATNVQSKLREFVSVKDFGITGDILIPTHFPNLQSALDAIGVLQNSVSQPEITIRIEAGHQLTSGALVVNKDYRHVTIKSDDATVVLSSSFTGPSDLPWSDALNFATNILLLGVNSNMPTLGCLIDAQGRCSHGYQAISSRGKVLPSCGVINAGRIALYAENSIINANGTNWQNAGQANVAGQQVGIWATTGSVVTAQAADDNGVFVRTNVSGSTGFGAGTSRGSILNVARLNALNCERGIEARRGVVYASDSNFTTSAIGINALDNVQVTARDCVFDAAQAVRVSSGAVVDITGSTLIDGTTPLPVTACQTISDATRTGVVRGLQNFNQYEGGLVSDNYQPYLSRIDRVRSSNSSFTTTSIVGDSQLFLRVMPGDDWYVEGDLTCLTEVDTTLGIGFTAPAGATVLQGSVTVITAAGNTSANFSGAVGTSLLTIPANTRATVLFTARINGFTAGGLLNLGGARLTGSNNAQILGVSRISAWRRA